MLLSTQDELVESKDRPRTLELRSFRCPNLMHEEKTLSLRISLGGASALTGHRQDARLVRIDAGAVPASFEFGIQPCRLGLLADLKYT
jgi:hypothetical protein